MKNFIFLLLIITSVTSVAKQDPMANYRDQRLKTFVYSEDEIFHIHSHFGLSTTVTLAPYEEIDFSTFIVGLKGIFTFTERKHGFTMTPRTLAPKEIIETNLNFDTNLRSYSFTLHLPKYLKNTKKSNYAVKFEYPDDIIEFAKKANKEKKLKKQKEEKVAARKEKIKSKLKNCENINLKKINYDYIAKGDMSLRPYDMFDDNEFTYIKLDKQASLTTLNKNGRERVLNSHPGCGYTIIEGVYEKIILTVDDGKVKEVTCITNHSFRKNKPKSYVKFSNPFLGE